MRTVTIAAGPPAPAIGSDDTVIVVDVIRSMTTAVTALAAGLRVFPVPSVEAAHRSARRLGGALLVGERGGRRPDGFDLDNSPAAMARIGGGAWRGGRVRPIVLLSSSGTPLLDAVAGAGLVLGACLRNAAATALFVGGHARHVHVLGAATRGQFREEDQLCCARIAAALAACGFALGDDATADVIARWSDAAATAFLGSRSVAYLRATRQLDDLDFILEHSDDDLDLVALHCDGELVCAATAIASCG